MTGYCCYADGYGKRIVIAGQVTIHGSGAVLDAAQKGGFFVVEEDCSLALDSMTLQSGLVKGPAVWTTFSFTS
jgi:hypothetical protein